MDLLTRCEAELDRAEKVRGEGEAVGANAWRSDGPRVASLYRELVSLERNLASRVSQMRERRMERENLDESEELELEKELTVYLAGKLSAATRSLQRELEPLRRVAPPEEEPLG